MFLNCNFGSVNPNMLCLFENILILSVSMPNSVVITKMEG